MIPATVAGLPDVIQLCALYRRSLVLLLSADEAEGQIVIDAGEIVHAFWGDLSGEDALYAMLASPDARFQSATASDLYKTPPPRTVHASAQQLLLEGARRQDEGSVLRPSRRFHAAAGASSTPAPAASRPSARPWLLPAALGLLLLIALGAWSRREPSTVVPVGTNPSRTPAEAVEVSVLGPTDRKPKLLSGKPAPRPESQLALSPTVVLRLLIDADGRVARASVYRSRPDLVPFERAALQAAKDYRFSPAARGATPVAVWINWPVAFTSRDATANTIQIKGSDTIGGAMGPELAAVFQEQTGVRVDFEALGSATAFGGLFDGTARIGASSRPVNAQELAEARALGIELKEYVIGYDGVAVIAHPRNPVRALTLEQVAALFSGATASWHEVPDGQPGPVHVFGRPAYSGTHEFFQNRVLGERSDPARRQFAADTRTFERSDDLVRAVSADPAAIGYVGLGYLQGGVKALSLSDGDPRRAVLPDANSVRNGSYPVYRPLLMYTNGPPTGIVAAFLRFVLSTRGQSIVEKHGFIGSDVEASTFVNDDVLAESPKVRTDVHRILFRPRSIELDVEARRQLEALAAELSRGEHRALIVGNADLQGSAHGNTQIAQQRAELVAAQLAEHGVAPELLRVEAVSAERPVATNGTQSGRNLNRRVDVYLVRR